ncbi:response regulator [Hydrogenophaga flava]|uniref:response regulator n=1 Tax=Hydrogenophaga flava TaxID=65657 RepID=UPI000B0771D9|nr:response regulator transcription factor [Hydrogenophaga flava]
MNDTTSTRSTDDRWRIVLLEDDERLRGFFEQSIRQHPALELCASFNRLREAQVWLEANPVDLLLTDLALPDGHGLELIYRLQKMQPNCETLVISVLGDEDTVLACVEAGAVGYIHKDTQPDDMGQIIVDVKRGASPISPMLARKLLQRLRQADSAEASPAVPAVASVEAVKLTARETDVLRLIARGYTYAEIGEMEGISKHTVQMHIKNLYGKLAVNSRGQAVYQAGLMGLVGPPGS